MQIGLIGAGNMARALARGWNRPVLVADPVDERAQALVAEVGGEALASNAEVAQRADLVVLCHKPAQLADVALEVAPHAKAVASILAATPLADLHDAYPGPACLSLHSLASRRGAPGRCRSGRSRAGGCARRAGQRVVRRARHARHAARRARRRRDGTDVVRSRLRRARRRGADRRGRAPRHSRRAERGAGRADARRYRGAAAAAVATTRSPSAARSPRRAGSPRVAWPHWSAAGCARPSATPSTRSSSRPSIRVLSRFWSTR